VNMMWLQKSLHMLQKFDTWAEGLIRPRCYLISIQTQLLVMCASHPGSIRIV